MEVVSLVGELFSWIGLALGLPLLLLVLLFRLALGQMEPVEIFIVARSDVVVGRWFAESTLHERPLRGYERDRVAGRESVDAYVSKRDSSRMRLDLEPTLLRAVWTLGVVLTSAGVCGFVISWLRVIFG